MTFLKCPWHVAWFPVLRSFQAGPHLLPHCASGMFLYPVARSAPSETPSDPPNTWTYLHLKFQARLHSYVVCLYLGSQRGSTVLGIFFLRSCLGVIQDGLPDFLTPTATGPHSSFCIILLRGQFPIKVGNQPPQFQHLFVLFYSAGALKEDFFFWVHGAYCINTCLRTTWSFRGIKI